MALAQAGQAGFTWLYFALMTVVSWGLYGVCLHTGQVAMADPVNGRWKAFFFVGMSYFLVAVLAPLAILLVKGAGWSMPAKGVTWSLIAGFVGAIGAFGVLLAFGAKGTPPVVMSIVFAGAPIVNAVVATSLHPPQGGLSAIKWQFPAGIVLAAIGAAMVMLYRPMPAPKKPAAQAAAPAAVASERPGEPGAER